MKPGGADRDIAVIGMACRFPDAADPKAFWHNLAAGVCSIREIPADRWDWRACWGDPERDAGASNCKWAAFIDGADRFDAAMFKINPREAAWIDPQQRILLELTWACLEDAGYAPLGLSKSRTGVFLGICSYDYKELLDRHAGALEGYYLTGTANTFLPNRISQFFDFRGPSLAVDTACSSSLIALDHALTAIRSGACDTALAGGVNLMFSPERFVPLSQLGMLSASGACRAFDAAADGYIRGEGAGLILLKPLARARHEGDRILGVIKGCEVNHGGRSRSMTSPNVYAQSSLIARAFRNAGIAPDSVSYIEAHGTGTPLGDPIEVAGLKRAFGQLFREAGRTVPAEPFCGIGAVKANIGHLESAAGIAGVIKTLLCMRYKQLPPLAGLKRPNPKLRLDGSPFYLVDRLRAWDVPVRRAGVSSFGFGGSNAHVILEEYADAPRRRASKSRKPSLIVLSALDEDRLRDSALRLRDFLQDDHHLPSIAYTLQTGRQPLPERLALGAADVPSLRASLTAFLDGKGDGVFRGRAHGPGPVIRGKAAQKVFEEALRQQDLDTIAALWVAGGELTEPVVPRSTRPRRVELPTYPFAGKRHWFESRTVPETVRLDEPASVRSRADVGSEPSKLTLQPLESFAEPGPDPGSRGPSSGRSGAPPNPRRETARPQPSLVEQLKRHQAAMERLEPGPEIDPADYPQCAPRPLDLERVRVRFERGVVEVTLADPAAKNAFSEGLVGELTAAFDHIRGNPDYKVVVVTGSGAFFCTGGTKEDLVAIQAGRKRFSDAPVYAIALTCDIPVIAAMQGHAIGAGWSMGMFCDEILFAEEGLYRCPYMAYGFTPGAGSTLVFPHRLGAELGWQVLYSAREHTGLDLRGLGLEAAVLPRAEVGIRALEMAREWARQPREKLVRDKSERMRYLRRRLDPTCALELALHDRNFVGSADVLDKVRARYPEGRPAGTAAEPGMTAVGGARVGDRDAPAVSRGARPGVRDVTVADHGASRADRDVTVADGGASVVDTLRALLASELHVEPGELAADASFVDMGLDSITGVTWVRNVNRHYGLSIPATQVYNHPTLRKFADFVAAQRGPAPVERSVRPRSAKPTTGIAVIGMAGRFPMARSLAEFWDNLIRGRDCVSEVPASRWPVDAYYDPDTRRPGKTNSRWMGALDGADEFDPIFFNLSPLEAEWMDPQQRLFLQACWHGIEDAGYAPSSLAGSRCGVFVGCAAGDYGRDTPAHELNAHGFMGGAAAILASRISYLLDLHGPSLAIDTACSASLVALASACDQLRAGACDAALAGGVNVMAGPSMHIMTTKTGMLSPDGRCYTFDERANGFVPAEGVGVVFLKRLEDAERDGDPIYGVIRGWGVNQDGRTNGITAPSGDAQAALEAEVYRKFDIDPEAIGLVEAHGTGTELGDPIEVEGLKAAFAAFTDKRHYCALGSVKSNIGHALTAAGIAGFLKVMLALRHRSLPPTIHFHRTNPHIDLQDAPFYINTTLKAWTDPQRLAAVSSFGFSGVNAHVVVEGVEPPASTGGSPGPVVLSLSARDEERLKEAAGALGEYLRSSNEVDLRDVAHTLRIGRDTMKRRLSIAARDRREAIEKLAAFAAGRPVEQATTASVEPGRRVHGLPGYPFARHRYWLGQPSPPVELRPELVRSAADRTDFTCTLGGQEFFLADHVVEGRRTLPAVAYLELARAAVEQLLPENGHGAVRLSRVVWAKPVVIDNGRRALNITLRMEGDNRFAYDIGDGSHGVAEPYSSPPPPPLDVSALRRRMSRGTVEAEAGYEAFRAMGLAYGPAHRGIRRLHLGDGEALAELVLPPSVQHTRGEYVLHPAMLDAALQATIGLAWPDPRPALPFALEALEIHGPCTERMWAWVHGDDVDVCADDGSVRACFRGLSLRARQEPAMPASQTLLFAAAPAEFPEAVDPARTIRELCFTEDDAFEDAAVATLEAIRELITTGRERKVFLRVTSADPLMAGLTPMLKTAELEHAGFRGAFVSERGEASGWHELPPQEAAAARPWKDGGVYLLTGGTGGLGSIFAEEIAACVSNPVILLAGRAEHPTPTLPGATVELVRADLARSSDVDALVRTVEQRHGRIDGVLHMAGIRRDERLIEKSPDTVRAVLAPKVAGLRNLERALRGKPLDLFVLFSSVAAVLGNPGQADYGAANAFMDAFAESSGRMISIAWPLWEGGGMQVDEATRSLMKSRYGMTPMSAASGLRAFYRALGTGRSRLLVLEGDPERLRRALRGRRGPARTPSERAEGRGEGRGDVRGEGRGEGVSEGRGEAVQAALLREVADLLKFDPEWLDADAELNEFGFDSITLTELANRLNDRYGLDLTPPIFFEFPTIAAFAQYLIGTYPETFDGRPAAAAAAAAAAAPRVEPPRSTTDGVAVIGMSGRFPMADDLDAFWGNLLDGRDCISEVPADRWDWRALYGDPNREPNKTDVKWGGFINGVGDFDARFFGLSPTEVELMDPHQRLLMLHVWQAIEDAGYSQESLSGSTTGVFVGTASSGYDHLIARSGMPVEGFTATGTVPSVGPNRISFLMNWNGPSEPVETACSSSLVAIHRGVEAIRSGRCSMAVVGGVNALVHPDYHISFNRAGMLCEDGRCKTFAAAANGYVRGEGIGILVLKPLRDAEADGDHVYGVIRGSAENHGGRTNSLTAPNPNAQAEVIREAFAQAGIDPRTIGYIETHGTGTPLGDPVEINGLKKAYAALLEAHEGGPGEAGHCVLGAVKTNIGHLELAAGVAGVIKVLLQLEHRTLVRSLHCEEVNPYIALEGGPFRLARHTRPWERLNGAPRRAGVSSFGFGGVNAHVVIEEHLPAKVASVPDDGPQPIVLSAKTEDRLVAAARNLLRHLERHTELRLADVAYTLRVGRKAMEKGLRLTATSLNDLRERLAAFLEKGAAAEGIVRGPAKQLLRDIEPTARNSGRRVSLPTYPFDLKRYWVPETTRLAPVVAARSGERAEPSERSGQQTERSTVVVAGAGLFGICFAHHLKQAGIDFVLLEREAGVGGVWYRNTWPGCGCDIPMIAYAYSFRHYRGPIWAKQPDILRYLEECVEELGLAQHLRLETEVTSATFDEDEGRWTVRTAGGTVYRCNYFCNAMGSGLGLYPNIPELPGLSSFDGPILHVLDYAQESPEVRGKRVAVIGNGATQLQVVEALQPEVERLVVYGREPKFVYPRARYNPETENELDRDYELWRSAREEYLKNADRFYDAVNDPVRLNPFHPGNEVKSFFNRIYDGSHEAYYAWCEERGLVPEYSPGCNRPLISDTYHEAVRAENVEVVQEPALQITATGIRSGDAHREFDVILLCTGYDLNDFRPRCPTYGRGGLSLTDYYGDGYPKGFLSYVRTFPNLFLGPGPNSGTNATSITAIYEFICEQLVRQIEHVRERGARTFEVREERVQAFREFIVRKNREAPFNSGCSSFYRDANDENVALFPGKLSEMRELFAFDASHFEYEGVGEAEPTPEYSGNIEWMPGAAGTAESTPGSADPLLDHLLRLASSVLKIPLHEIDDTVSFEEYGVDSIMMLNITRKLAPSFPALTTDELLRVSSIRGFRVYLLSQHRDDVERLVAAASTPPPVATAAMPGAADMSPAGATPHGAAAAAAAPPGAGATAAAAPPTAPAATPIAAAPPPQPAKTAAKDIAVIGMSGRFPMAASIAELWDNLREGRECVERFDREALREAGVPEREYRHPYYVPAKPRLKDADRFDPLFFSMSPTEAVTLDPQQRLMLEEAWRALEDAGYPPTDEPMNVGVYVSQFMNTYAVRAFPELDTAGKFKAMLGNDKDYLATRLAYKLNFRGPAYTVQTACSSSLTAVHLCATALRAGECDLGLVGGVAVTEPSVEGYRYDKDLVFSRDGHCRPFSEDAGGTVFGEGIGVVVLKRLEDAERDGDAIYAVIKGSAVNNDGREKRDFTAPGFRGQSEVVAAALKDAGISAEQVGLVEAHATGTRLGDPLEVAALTEAYRRQTERTGYCALGSVKANVGHLNTAAGIAGFIKAVQSLHHQELTPQIHCETPHPDLRLAQSPFFINRARRPWTSDGEPRHAAVSSFGIGGTNAHVVLREYESSRRTPASGPDPALIVLSAKSDERLVALVRALADFVAASPELDLHDLAYTLQVGRAPLEYRTGFLAASLDEVRAKLPTSRRVRAKRGPEATGYDDPKALLDHWLGSGRVDWSRLPRPAAPRRVHLPTYPFAGERYHWGAPQPGVGTASRRRDALIARPTWIDAPVADLSDDLDVHEVLHIGLDLSFGTPLRTNKKTSATRFAALAAQVMKRLQALIASRLDQPTGFQLLIAGEDERAQLRGLSGMLRSVRREHPNVEAQLIEVDAGLTDEEALRLLRRNRLRPDDVHVRCTGGGRRVVAWEAIVPVADSAARPWKDGGVYLITGGAGGLGLLFAEAIARDTRDAVIVLTGRSARFKDAERFASSGARVLYRRADVSRSQDVARLIAFIEREAGRLDGVLHAAGITRDGFLRDKSEKDLREVLAPKVAGARNLDRATAACELDFFVLFSSVVGAVGHPGQAGYAAANAFMDAFAHTRNGRVACGERHGRTLSVNWGLWTEGGLLPDAAALERIERQTGMQPLATADGLRAFEQAWASGESQVLAAAGDREMILRRLTGAPRPARASSTPARASSKTSRAAPPPGKGSMLPWLKVLTAEILGLPADAIDAYEPLEAYGIDSLRIASLNDRLEEQLGEISKTLFFEYQTLAELADYFEEHHAEVRPAARAAGPYAGEDSHRGEEPHRERHRHPDDDSIAIIGLSGAYPRARTLDELWENQRSGRDCITEIPADRWALDGFYHPDPDEAVARGGSYSKWGGFLESFAEFDPLFFNIAPKDALNIDPQERLFLQCTWEALEDAGYTRAMLAEIYGGRVGVFAGITQTGFNLHRSDWRSREETAFPHTSFSSAANRVSYFLDLNGPSMPIDTMCSSSLVAVHEACEHIRHGACELALAGGVNLYLHPSTYVGLCAARMLSLDGRCKSFGAGGNGYVPGEGVGVVLLKRLSWAIADGDHIHAVIRATGVNHGGKTNGYTVPNPVAQAELIRETLDRAGIDAGAVSYIEAHGTGTEMGDPIEITGLTQAFRHDTDDTGFCAIGSIKSNLGHLEAAAGIAGLTRIVLQMRHGQLAPSLHAEELNPNIAFEKTPFVVQRELGAWEGPRIAGLSSFGAGGANAHAILEAWAPAAEPDDEPDDELTGEPEGERAGPWAILLSARNEDRLRAAAANLLRHVTSQAFLEGAGPRTLRDLAFTLQTGREPMDERLAFVVTSLEEIDERLRAFLDGREGHLHRGRVARSKEQLAAAAASASIDRWMEERDYDRLLAHWVEGVPMDWRDLYRDERPRRIGLPTYPFARDRYWLTSGEGPDAEWLFLREAWSPEPLPEGLDWSERMRRQAGRRVQVIGPGEGADALVEIIEKLQRAAGMPEPLELQVGTTFDRTPDIVLIQSTDQGVDLGMELGLDLDLGVDPGVDQDLGVDPGVDQDLGVDPSVDLAVVFETTRSLMRSAWETPIRFYLLYPGDGAAARPHREALAGFVGAAMMENGHHVWTLVEQDDSDRTAIPAQRLLQEWLADDETPFAPAPSGLFQTAPLRHVRHDGAGRHLRRRLAAELPLGSGSPFRSGGAYLIAGGLGLIGTELCRELARRFGARLAILSRGPFDEARRRQAADIERLGGSVHYYVVDIVDETALRDAVAEVRRDLGALNGVIHMATAYGSGLIATKSADTFRRDIGAKVDGTVNLDRVTAEDPLDFFMLYSSIGAFGIRGSSCHSYSCSFQNAFARHRDRLRERGERAGAAWSLCWGPWTSDPIHAAADPDRAEKIRADGFALNTMATAFPVMEAACLSGEPVLGLFSVRDPGRVRRRLCLPVADAPLLAFEDHLSAWEGRGTPLSIEELSEVIPLEAIESLPPTSIDRVYRLVFPAEGAPGPRATNGDLRSLVRETLADVLRLTQVDDRETFQNYGMDSVSAMVFATRLEKKLKRGVKPEWLIDHPSVERLLDRLEEIVSTEPS